MKTTAESEIRRAAAELNTRLSDLEMNLIELRTTGGQDGVRYAAQLLSRLNHLANGVSGSDFRPPDQHLETAKLLQERLKGQASTLATLIEKGRLHVQRHAPAAERRTGHNQGAMSVERLYCRLSID